MCEFVIYVIFMCDRNRSTYEMLLLLMLYVFVNPYLHFAKILFYRSQWNEGIINDVMGLFCAQAFLIIYCYSRWQMLFYGWLNANETVKQSIQDLLVELYNAMVRILLSRSSKLWNLNCTLPYISSTIEVLDFQNCYA